VENDKNSQVMSKDFILHSPVLAFFDLNGKRVVRHTGFANKKDFLLLANYFVDKSYKKEPFILY
jgi:thioredoxin-related protein